VLAVPVTTGIAALLVPQELTQIEESPVLNAMRLWWYSFIPGPALQLARRSDLSRPADLAADTSVTGV